jgi:hypothetical protein
LSDLSLSVLWIYLRFDACGLIILFVPLCLVFEIYHKDMKARINGQLDWVDCPPEMRLSHGLARDGKELRRRWVEEWMPQEERYIEQQRPQAFAHVVVNGAPV